MSSDSDGTGLSPGTHAVVVVDRDRLFREGLLLALRGSNFAMTGSYPSLEAFQNHAGQKPDFLLIGPTTVPALRAASEAVRDIPTCRILAFYDEGQVFPETLALAGRVDGLLPRNRVDSDLLLKALDLLLLDFKIGPQRTPIQMRTGAPPPDAEPAQPGLDLLTQREKEVLSYLMQGLSNKWIVRRSGIAESTVKTHTRNLMAKIGVRNRTEAAAWGFRHGASPAAHPCPPAPSAAGRMGLLAAARPLTQSSPPPPPA